MNKASVNYQIKRSERAKKARILVTAKNIEVIAPFHISEQCVHNFVIKNERWIINTQTRLIENLKQSPSFSLISTSNNGLVITFQGTTYPLIYFSSERKSLNILFHQEFIINGPYFNSDREKLEAIELVLIKWMKQQTKLKVQAIVRQYAPTNQLWPNSISIKSQKSRWGSCSNLNNININWRLILAPPPVLEYVVVHELCHIKHKNHSQHFWKLVAQHLPDFPLWRNWLKTHGQALLLVE